MNYSFHFKGDTSFDILNIMGKQEFRFLIKHCFVIGKNTIQAGQWLKKCYPTFVASDSMVLSWQREFKCGRTKVLSKCFPYDFITLGTGLTPKMMNDQAVNMETIKQIHEIVWKNQRVKIRK